MSHFYLKQLYHLIENLKKVGGSQRRINEAQAYLRMGQVEKAGSSGLAV